MNRIKNQQWLLADKICMAQGNAVASNLMFESKKDHKLFFRLWNTYLGEMVDVINYHLTPTSWTMLFKTKDETDIRAAYQKLRSQSKKAKPKCTLKCASKMLSEHVRLFLSQFVRRCNSRTGRKGTKVLESFRKFVFEKEADYNQAFRYIINKKRELKQNIERYRADETKFDLKGEMRGDSIWKVGNRIYEGLEKWDKVLKNMCLDVSKYSVLRNLTTHRTTLQFSSFFPLE